MDPILGSLLRRAEGGQRGRANQPGAGVEDCEGCFVALYGQNACRAYAAALQLDARVAQREVVAEGGGEHLAEGLVGDDGHGLLRGREVARVQV